VTDDASIWRGELRRGSSSDEIVGELVDLWGWRVALHGTKRPGTAIYDLVGTLDGQVPKALQQPIDNEG
jgi:hypothetical protein